MKIRKIIKKLARSEPSLFLEQECLKNLELTR